MFFFFFFEINVNRFSKELKLIDNILKIPKEESHRLPKCLIDCPEYEKDFKPNDQDAIPNEVYKEEIKKEMKNC